jgi:acetyltransferase-like isoleucine patch superfamily enzyme
MGQNAFKIKHVTAKPISRWRQYAEWFVGKTDPFSILKYELITFFFGTLPGALGFYLRSKFYPLILGSTGRKVVFGRGITVRHPHKIRIGHNVIIDDYCVLDAKGQSNTGISIGDEVFIGRNSILYCKNGDIEIQSQANISSNCEVFSSNRVVIGRATMMAGYCYIMSGGSYEYGNSHIDFVSQDGYSKGPTVIGKGCWIGARVVVLDGVSIGDRAVVGAGAVVTKPIPRDSLAVGIPAKVIETIEKTKAMKL